MRILCFLLFSSAFPVWQVHCTLLVKVNSGFPPIFNIQSPGATGPGLPQGVSAAWVYRHWRACVLRLHTVHASTVQQNSAPSLASSIALTYLPRSGVGWKLGMGSVLVWAPPEAG